MITSHNHQAQSLPKTLGRFLWHFLKQRKLSFITSQILWCGWSLDQSIFPLLLGRIVNGIAEYTGPRTEAWLVLGSPILGAMFFWIAIELCFRAAGFLDAYIRPALNTRIREAMFTYIQGHSFRYFSERFSGDLANKMSDMPESIYRFLNMTQTLFIPVLVALCLSGFVLYSISPLFALIMIIWAIFHIAICFYFSGHKGASYATRHALARSRLNGMIADSLRNFFMVKVFGTARAEQDHIALFQKDEQNNNTIQMLYSEKVKAALSFMTFLLPGLAINGYAYFCWVNHHILVGDVVTIFNSMWNITMMLWWASAEIPMAIRDWGTAQQALRMIQDEHEVTSLPDAPLLTVTQGEIDINHLSFAYEAQQPLFKDFSLHIPGGQKVGLVGYSGSGKTSIVRLLLRLFDAEQGRIMIDGQDIKTVDVESLRRAIGFIPQEPTLFHRSFLENIRYGTPGATDEQVFEAARQAYAHDFISKTPLGYHTQVGDGGVKLSGGQRQRIMVARAMLKNAPILILDEATGALDSVTEAYLQESFLQLMQCRTTLVIAHRLSTLLHMDRILVFEQGKIVEDGTHDDLLSRDGMYAYLWKMQSGGILTEMLEDSDDLSECVV